MSQHSKAPFTIEESNWCGHPDCQHGHVEIMVINANGFPVHRWQADFGIEEQRANARLFAAAPDLLAALKALVPVGLTGTPTREQIIAHWQHEEDEGNELAPLVLDAYAAIAKTEGQG